MTRYNSRGSSNWKLKATAGAVAVAAGVGGGLALTSHPATTVHDSAYQYGFGQGG